MMMGCTPYAEDEEMIQSRDPEEYSYWCAENEDRLNDRD